MPKLSTYKKIKTNICQEKYLSCVVNNNHRIALSRLRCSAHKLAIEEGRFRNIERCNRKCVYCHMKVVEDEYHFVLVCPFYRDERKECLPKYYCNWPSLQKFKGLLASNQTSILCKLAKFIYIANKKRTG